MKSLDDMLVEVFRAHWKSVNKRIVDGIDIAEEFADAFFAGHPQKALRIARRYYFARRSATLADAKSGKILSLCEPWLAESRQSLLDWSTNRGDLRRQLQQLVASEYVALVWHYKPLSEFSPGEPSVCPLPDRSVLYGDVYEITASGMSTGATLRVFKSVAYPFLDWERREARVGIRNEFYANARSADPDDWKQWRLKFHRVRDPRVIEAEIIKSNN